MNTIALKTNINCSGCVARVTPVLNKVAGENNWKVDTQNPDKILSVDTDSISEQDLIQVIAEAGFKAQSVSS